MDFKVTLTPTATERLRLQKSTPTPTPAPTPDIAQHSANPYNEIKCHVVDLFILPEGTLCTFLGLALQIS